LHKATDINNFFIHVNNQIKSTKTALIVPLLIPALRFTASLLNHLNPLLYEAEFVFVCSLDFKEKNAIAEERNIPIKKLEISPP